MVLINVSKVILSIKHVAELNGYKNNIIQARFIHNNENIISK